MDMYIFSIGLIVVSNVIYNLVQKALPGNVDPYASLLVSYIVAGLIAAAFFLFTQTKGITASFRELNWLSAALAVGIVGIEMGYLLAFRAGWEISQCSLIANILLAVVLIPIGMLFFGERLDMRQLGGIALCLAGFWLLNK